MATDNTTPSSNVGKRKPSLSGIYAIVNRINGKRYIGSAVSLSARWYEHRFHLTRNTHANKPLQRAWKKYGANNFEFVVLLHCPRADLLKQEQRFFDILAPEYNLCLTAGSTLGRMHSKETRAKIAAKALGRKHTVPRGPDWRAKLSAVHKGKPKSEESKQKNREAHLGKVLTPEHRAKIGTSGRAAYATGKRIREKSPEHRAKIAATLKGGTHSAERRAKQAAAQRGRKHDKPYNLDPTKAQARTEAGKRLAESHRGKKRSATTIEKMRQKLTGRKLTPEHRAKIGAASLAMWARRKRERPQPEEPPLLRLMQAATI